MINRLRVVLPPDSIVIGAFLVFAIAEGPFAFLEWKLQQPLVIHRPGLLVVRLIALAYGFWRFSNFHPVYQPDYRAWLERGPWNYKLPLPAGPIRLVWEDALPLAALTIMAAFLGPIVPYRVASLFLFGYLGSFVLASFQTGIGSFGYATAFGMGLAIREWPSPLISLGVLVATLGLAMIGLRVALARFPWPPTAGSTRSETLAKPGQDVCGWPFDQLKPKINAGLEISRVDGLMIGLLTGWFLFATESLIERPVDQTFFVHLVFVGAVGMLAALRVLIYTVGYSPPINLLGRIRRFRWIIPGYDKIFLAPLCTILVGMLASDRFRPPGLDDLVVLPIGLALAVVVTIDTGPSLKTWRLTGQHRITITGPMKGGEFVKVV